MTSAFIKKFCDFIVLQFVLFHSAEHFSFSLKYESGT